ncbi:MAG: ATP-binding protein [Sterolibacteriaceae bacterium MAG5]|nr:ATP-binding protein [Candidatus Nitricoxidireducens bremensis]
MRSDIPADYGNMLVTLRRLVHLRWLLLIGALGAILGVPPLLEIPLPTLPLLLALAVLAGFNFLTASRLARAEVQTPWMLTVQIVVDLVALGVILFLSGGAANPLVSLLLLPVAAGALVLAWHFAAAIAALAIGLYSLLAVWFVPLNIPDASRAASLHLAGMWLTFVVSVILIAWLIVRMTASIRARDAALARVREQALRDERVVALGALAAGAAHELGTPLATMAVVVGELDRDPVLPPAMRADMDLLRQQIAACKEIVTGLADRAGAGRLEGARPVRADEWLDAAAARWRATRPREACFVKVDGAGDAPEIVVDATLEQALLNLLNNAANASGAAIDVRLDWDAAVLTIEIADSGAGFPPHVLEQAGSAPLASGTGGAGIGLLLTHAAVTRLGGRLKLSNRAQGGGVARIELPLAAFAASGR